jgi:hypothetical protein
MLMILETLPVLEALPNMLRKMKERLELESGKYRREAGS